MDCDSSEHDVPLASLRDRPKNSNVDHEGSVLMDSDNDDHFWIRIISHLVMLKIAVKQYSQYVTDVTRLRIL